MAITDRVVIVDVVGTPICVSVEAGDKLYRVLSDVLRAHAHAELSFLGVERLTTAFLNAGVGQLYNEFSESDVRASLNIVDATDNDLRLLDRVIQNAKRFFQNPGRQEELMNEAVGIG